MRKLLFIFFILAILFVVGCKQEPLNNDAPVVDGTDSDVDSVDNDIADIDEDLNQGELDNIEDNLDLI